MNGIHRNARFARLALAGLALLCLLVFLVAREQERAALSVEVGAAERRAHLYADTVLHDSLESRAVSAPITGEDYRKLHADIRDGILDDPLVARVRLWAPDGTLLFSTAADERDKIGRLRVNEDPAITAAAGGSVSTRLATAPLSTSANGGHGAETDLLETFVPLRVSDRTDVLGAVQIDQRYDSIRARAVVPWNAVQWVCLGLVVLFGALLVSSLRRRATDVVVEPATSASGFDPPVAERSSRVKETHLAEESARAEETVDQGETARAEQAARAEERADRDAVTSLRAEHDGAVAALGTELATAAAARHEAERVADDAPTEAGAHHGTAAETRSAESDRLAEAEQRASEAEQRASEAERRATDLELMLVAAQDAADEALAARAALSGPTASLEAQAIELLEARVIAAEDRAAEAERRLAELGFEGPPNGSNGHVAPPSSGQWAAETEPYAPTVDDPMAFGASNGHRSEPDAPEPSDGQLEDQDEPDGPPVSPISAEASDLRARLARSAARKKRSLEP